MIEKNWHALDVGSLQQEFKTDLERGLNTEEADARLKTFGPNALEEEPPRSFFVMIYNQLKDVLVLILIAAALISAFIGEWRDSIVILIIVILNGTIRSIKENKARYAMKALKDMTKPLAKVIRGGNLLQISSEKVVPGDLFLVEAGDFVPADSRLIEAASLYVDESALTGESIPVEKDTAVINTGQLAVGDRKNMLFMGTAVTGGRGKALVVETGMKTQLGRIAELLETAEEESTPLQQRLASLGKVLGIAAGAIVVVVLALGLYRGIPLPEMFMVSISLAVAAVPEGLTAVVTIVLAMGVTRMSQRQAIIRRLPAVETLGAATVICSDKTGTLTKNEMTVTGIFVADSFFQVTGSGYEPEGKFLDKNGKEMSSLDTNLDLLLLGGLLNSDAQLEQTDTGYQVAGDPTEVALVVAAAKAGITKKETETKYPRLAEIPFDSNRKMMTTFHLLSGTVQSFTKGAPDVLLSRCSKVLSAKEPVLLDEGIRKHLLEVNSGFALQGQRVLALATRLWPEVKENYPKESDTAERDLTFIGFYAIQDPPRPEAKEAVAVSRGAGIRSIMITGDHRDTAIAIAKELDLLQPGDEVMTGDQIEMIDEEGLRKVANKVAVYARVSPEHKLRIVSALKHHGHVVAMTGDGVNDAPALKRADIGAAMGISGTEVARGASDMVLRDDNFATIVKAIEEGRTIYNNIRSSVQFLLSCNAGEIITIFVALLLGLGNPLTPIQILWMNLVTDGAPALALGLEPPLKGLMKKPPRNPREGLFAGGMGAKILWQGFVIGAMCLVCYFIGLRQGLPVKQVHTMVFATLCMCQLVHSFNVRSLDQSLFSIGFFTNRSLVLANVLSVSALLSVIFVPFLRDMFGTELLQLNNWLLVLGLSIVPLVAVEISKAIGKLSITAQKKNK
ncbi:MAG TPA: ATPase [Desulfotomaculum sp.]|nr:MAG: Cation transport ATPase [Desulfotomaculum sp. 46_80]HAG10504.1 ATPase [Desulfotomaculum sp.]HBY04073.1 ATPase [Desulfotomaculum sp.]